MSIWPGKNERCPKTGQMDDKNDKGPKTNQIHRHHHDWVPRTEEIVRKKVTGSLIQTKLVNKT